MTCILSILYHNLNALGPLHVNAEYSGINCLNISLGGSNVTTWLVALLMRLKYDAETSLGKL